MLALAAAPAAPVAGGGLGALGALGTGGVVGGILAGLGALTSWIPGVGDWLSDAGSNTWDWAKNAAGGAWDWGIDAGSSIGKEAIGGLGGLLDQASPPGQYGVPGQLGDLAMKGLLGTSLGALASQGGGALAGMMTPAAPAAQPVTVADPWGQLQQQSPYDPYGTAPPGSYTPNSVMSAQDGIPPRSPSYDTAQQTANRAEDVQMSRDVQAQERVDAARRADQQQQFYRQLGEMLKGYAKTDREQQIANYNAARVNAPSSVGNFQWGANNFGIQNLAALAALAGGLGGNAGGLGRLAGGF